MTDPIEIIARGLAVAHSADPDFVIQAQRPPLQIVPSNGQLPPPPAFEGPWWTLWKNDARAALRALTAAGYAVVPIEPTDDAERSGGNVCNADCAYHGCDFQGVYRAMVTAGSVKVEE